MYSSIKFALAGGFVLDVILAGLIYFGWKRIWSKFPILNTLLFPDLNGFWIMKIYWVGKESEGVVDAIATIKQDFIKISMEVKSERSDSETMMVRPSKDPESGRPSLMYFYRVIPKQMDKHAGPSYEGAAILKFEGSTNFSLSGNYFTSRQTKGHFVLSRT